MKYTLEDIKKTRHPNEPISNLPIDYIDNLITWLVSNFTKITPNQITTFALILGIISAYFFLKGNLLVGGLFYLARHLMDGVDGRLSRVKNLSTKWGAWYENYCGLILLFLNLSALCYGQYLLTTKSSWLILWPVTLFSFWLHNWESMKMAIILGDKFKEKVVKSSGKGLIAKVKNLLNKYGFTEPFNNADGLFLLFIVAPITGFVKEIFYIWLIVVFSKAVFWFIYYRSILKSEDIK